jgi:hypothetical protein
MPGPEWIWVVVVIAVLVAVVWRPCGLPGAAEASSLGSLDGTSSPASSR